MGLSSPAHQLAIVCKMEDVLAVHHRPLDPNRPLICFDEIGTELLATPRGQLPLAAGQGIRQDDEYERRGARNLFLAVAPLMGYGAVAFDPTSGSCYNGGVKGVVRLARTAPCDTMSIRPR